LLPPASLEDLFIKGGITAKRKIVFLMVLIMSVLTSSIVCLASEPYLMLFGGENHTVFLGYVNANKYETNSIWNKYGKYGSKYSSDSIWNKYGTYGSKYNNYSPWNKYTFDGSPVIVDKYGNFYGNFTVNNTNSQQTKIKLCLWILGSYDYIMENFDDVANVIK
jgi:hypothetical protein